MYSEKRRNSLQIIGEILSIATEGAKMTEIVYKSNLNFVRGRRYVEFLLAEGLMAIDDEDPKIFRTTEKGNEFLKKFQVLKKLI